MGRKLNVTFECDVPECIATEVVSYGSPQSNPRGWKNVNVGDGDKLLCNLHAAILMEFIATGKWPDQWGDDYENICANR